MELENQETNMELPKKPTFSIFDKIGSICIFFASLFLIYTSGTLVFQFFNGDLDVDLQNIIINAIFLSIGIIALLISIRFIKKSILYEQLLDLGFEDGIYTRFEPILQEIVKAQIEMKDIYERIDAMNMNIENLRKRSVEIKMGDSSAFGIDISAQISRFLRLVLLVNITLAAFIYLLYFTREFTPTLLTFLFIVWWLEITFEFNLWHKSSAYIWVFFPILTIPITAILSAVIWGHDLLIGSMMLTLAVYSIAYYSWSRYIVEGMLPFNINVVISEFQKSESSSAKLITEIASKKSTITNILINNRLRIHKSSIYLSLLFFVTTLFSFLVDNALIPISWKQSHLPGFMASIDSQILTGIISLVLFILWKKTKNID